MYELSEDDQRLLLSAYSYADQHPEQIDAGMARLLDLVRRSREEARLVMSVAGLPLSRWKDDLRDESWGDPATGQAAVIVAAWELVREMDPPDVTKPREEQLNWAYQVLALVDRCTNPAREWGGVRAHDAGRDYKVRLPRRLLWDFLGDDGARHLLELVGKALFLVRSGEAALGVVETSKLADTVRRPESPGGDAASPRAMLSATDIARANELPGDALRKALERERRTNLGNWFHETRERGRRGPKYLYVADSDEVLGVVERLRTAASAKRPPTAI